MIFFVIKTLIFIYRKSYWNNNNNNIDRQTAAQTILKKGPEINNNSDL